MAIDAPRTSRRRSPPALAHPATRRRAKATTVTWPASTPQLKARRARSRRPSGHPSSPRTPAKPRPWSRPKAKTRKSREGRSLGGEQVLDGDVDDGDRDQGLHHARRESDDAIGAEAQSQGVGEGEGGDLGQERPGAGRQEGEAHDEEDVVEPLREDVGEAQGQKTPRRLSGRLVARGPGQRESVALGSGHEHLFDRRTSGRVQPGEADQGEGTRGEERRLLGARLACPRKMRHPAEKAGGSARGRNLPLLRKRDRERGGHSFEAEAEATGQVGRRAWRRARPAPVRAGPGSPRPERRSRPTARRPAPMRRDRSRRRPRTSRPGGTPSPR